MDDLTKEELEQLMSVFRDQALGILDEMSQDLLLLEGDPSDEEAMARLRRGAHTIKGDAACIGLECVTELSHRLEDFMEVICRGALTFEASVVNVFLESLDQMRGAIGGEEVGDLSQTALGRMLDAIAAIESSRGGGQSVESKVVTPLGSPDQSSALFSLEQSLAVAQASQNGCEVYLLSGDQDLTESEIQALSDDEQNVSLLFNGDGAKTHNVLLATVLPLDTFLEWIRSRCPHDGYTVARAEVDEKMSLHFSPLPQTEDVHPAAPKRVSAVRRGIEFVRVEAARIDALLNLAGEMVIARSVMNQVVPDLERAFPKNELVTRFSGASAHMGKLIAELQKGVLKMRMVTIDHVFRRFNRPMRELAAERGKLAALEISGGDTELDRTLVDLIYEPLLHILRNAVDHGLESPAEREAADKPPVGQIKLRAYHEGNQVVIEASDDGRGVDIEGLKAKAVKMGHLSEEQASHMSEEDALELMFLQGISTAKEISRVSGRGVGAAAVKSVVEELRGSISVRTQPGSGTTFTIRMPLTLAIIKALLFGVGEQLFALPLLAVSEVAFAETSDIVRLDGFESFRLRDRFISVVRPGLVLGFQAPARLPKPKQRFFIIVVAVAGKRFGISADTLMGEQEVVIKPLDSEWLQNEALAGASVLGDGRVVLILDAGSMLRKAVKYERTRGGNQMVA